MLGLTSAASLPSRLWTCPLEARNFTPWLLKDVDVLGDLLGMDLMLDVAEQPVGGFSLGLFGRTSQMTAWSSSTTS